MTVPSLRANYEDEQDNYFKMKAKEKPDAVPLSKYHMKEKQSPVHKSDFSRPKYLNSLSPTNSESKNVK